MEICVGNAQFRPRPASTQQSAAEVDETLPSDRPRSRVSTSNLYPPSIAFDLPDSSDDEECGGSQVKVSTALSRY